MITEERLARIRATTRRRDVASDEYQRAITAWEAGAQDLRDPVLIAAAVEFSEAAEEWNDLAWEVMPELLAEFDRLRKDLLMSELDDIKQTLATTADRAVRAERAACLGVIRVCRPHECILCPCAACFVCGAATRMIEARGGQT